MLSNDFTFSFLPSSLSPPKKPLTTSSYDTVYISCIIPLSFYMYLDFLLREIRCKLLSNFLEVVGRSLLGHLFCQHSCPLHKTSGLPYNVRYSFFRVNL